MDLGITGKRALVTGADSGIGWATTRELLAEGATVVMTDRDPQQLEAAAARLEAPAVRLIAIAADITRVDELARLGTAVREIVGDIDILVQCAGITGAQGLFHEVDDEGWTSTIEVDLLGPVRLVREFLPSLRTGGWGRIVFVASEDAVQPYDDELPYCSAKAGVLALSKGLSRSYASEGLLVNAVSPAFIATPMTDAMMRRRADESGTSFDEAVQSFLAKERPYLELQRRGEGRRGGRRHRVPVLGPGLLRERIQLPGRRRLGRDDLIREPCFLPVPCRDSHLAPRQPSGAETAVESGCLDAIWLLRRSRAGSAGR